MMKALRFYTAKDLRIDDVPRPECGDDEVRIKVAYCGICGSDIHEYMIGPKLYGGTVLADLMDGKIPADPTKEVNRYTGAKLPQIMGHELSGTILEIGKNVTHLSLGQRVVVNAALDDRHHGHELCYLCQEGQYNVCDRNHFYGVNAPAGGFAEEMVVKALAIVPIPNNISLKVAALAEPLAVAAHAISLAKFQPGQDAIVLGAGPIGCALVFLLKDSGARKVLVSEVAESRLALASVAGADRTVDPTREDVVAVAREMTGGRGVHVSFDACGVQATLDAAVDCIRAHGLVVNVALHEKPLSFDFNRAVMREKRLVGSNAYMAEDFERVVEVLAKRGAEVERFITGVVSLEDAVEGGFEEIVNNKAKHNKILVELAGGD